MELGRLRKGEWLAAAASVALFVLLFVPWYGAGDAGWFSYVPGPPGDRTAWQSFSAVDLLLALTAALGLTLAVTTATHRAPAVPVAFASIATAAALISLVVVVYRLVDQPGPNDLVETRIGAYLGLLAVLGILAGGWITMGDERPETETRPPVPARPAPPATAPEGSVVARGVAPEAAPQRES
jgi:hypothetical protein